jgi:hypothetical protein
MNLKSVLSCLFGLIFTVSHMYATESTVVAVGGDHGDTPGDVITVTHSGSTPSAITLKVPATITGALTATTTLTATSGNITASAGNLIFSTAGTGVQIKEGTNARMGRSTMSSGNIVVSNNGITSNTRFILTRSSLGGTAGHIYISSRNAVNFTITSTTTADQSVVDWVLQEAQ